MTSSCFSAASAIAGKSTNPVGVFAHRQTALDVFALLKPFGVQHFQAMRISTGAMTLRHMATRRPDRVDAMVLIGGTSISPSYRALRAAIRSYCGSRDRSLARTRACSKTWPSRTCGARGKRDAGRGKRGDVRVCTGKAYQCDGPRWRVAISSGGSSARLA